MSTSAPRKAFLLLESSITGLIRVALSLKLGGMMKLFRVALWDEVYATCEVLEGPSSVHASTYRRLACFIFCSGGVVNSVFLISYCIYFFHLRPPRDLRVNAP